MEKVKLFFKKSFDAIKSSIKSFPVTIIIVAVVSLFLCGQLIWDYAEEENIVKIVFSAMIFVVGTYFTENVAKDLKKEKILLYILSFISAIGFYLIVDNVEEESLYNVFKVSVCYIAALFISSVYIQFKESKTSFEVFFRELTISAVKVNLIYSVLSIGVMLLSFAMYELFELDDMEIILGVLELLVAGFFYIPRMLYIFKVKEEKRESNGFFEALFKYPLGLLIIAAFAIIYMYMLKIGVSHEVPSNVIFRITAALFMVSAPSWTIICSYKAKNVYEKIFNILPLLFLPFVILQCYSVGVRIADYGLTPIRYLGVVLIICEIAYILAYYFKREKIHLVMPLIVVVIWIVLLAPGINMDKLSESTQIARVKEYFKVEDISDLTKEQKEKITNAYYYLYYLDNGDEILNNIFTQEQRENIRKFRYEKDEVYHPEKDPQAETDYIYFDHNMNYFNVEGYSKVYTIDFRRTRYYEDSEDDPSTFIEEFDDGTKIDLKIVVDKMIELGDKTDYAPYIEIDENTIIVLDYVDMEYIDSNNLRHCYFEGWVLVK